ncbi:MAG: response regulator [Anaerolineae bacterium]|nr:response regulator [Anaerolineae bacterium]
MNEPPHRPIRVVFADDHPLTREGIRAALQQAPDIEIVGEAADGLEAQRMVAELRPDILLLDLVMPGLPSSEIEQWVRAHCEGTTVLVLTAHGITPKTVECHVTRILDKLGVRPCREALAWARDNLSELLLPSEGSNPPA